MPEKKQNNHEVVQHELPRMKCREKNKKTTKWLRVAK